MSRNYVDERLRQIAAAPEPESRPVRNARILLRAQAGESYAAIARDFGMTAMGVSKIARRRGVAKRGEGPRLKPKATALGFKNVQQRAFIDAFRNEKSKDPEIDEVERIVSDDLR